MIRLENIHKDYGSVKANDGVNLSVRPGSIHALLGENGAGKTTLMKILSGFIAKTSGRIFVCGNEVDISSPVKALKAGIGMMYQEPMDFPQMTVLDNLMAGRPSGFFISRKKALHDLDRFSSDLGFSFNPASNPASLTLGERQQLEMIRLLSLGVKVLILDEPTTGITDLQKDVLFFSLRRLAKLGHSIILVSHKMDDVTSLCDEATVMRQGKVSGHFSRPFSSQDLLQCMFPSGGDVDIADDYQPGDPFYFLDQVTASSSRVVLKPISLNFRQGEIVGLAGLEGSGQELLLRVAAGVSHIHTGAIRIGDTPLTARSMKAYQSSGVFFVPGSRMEEGLISGLTLSDHVALCRSGHTLFTRKRAVESQTSRFIENFFIKASPHSLVDSLSGGNQQKFLLSLLPDTPRILFLENPTRGLDHDATAAIWNILKTRVRHSGSAVVFSSSELDEILQVAHRVLVFSNGELMMDRLCHDLDPHDIGQAVSGIKQTKY